ncbi:MAG: SUMF1/EgtB/PvdO family nonheme iron enzyme [Vicinamibacterales bacterium]
MTTATLPDLDRRPLLDWYRRNRERSAALFDLLADEAYYSQPIALRHPIVFYEGHLPGFSFNTLVKRGLGRPSIDAALESLFARGIDPHESQASNDASPEATRARWPSRETVRQFAAEADRQVIEALREGPIVQPGHPLLDGAEAAYGILEHEAMHQETLAYMWHRLPFDQKRRPEGYAPVVDGTPPAQAWVDVPAGRATLGVDRGAVPFAWDNERPAYAVDVPGFAIQRHNVTNADFLEFVEAGGYANAGWWRPEDWAWRESEGLTHPMFWERHADGTWAWRGMFDRVSLPGAWPVYVSQAEAHAYAAWRGLRLPTEAEFQRAAFGAPEGDRPLPWGSDPTVAGHGVYDFVTWDPQPAGSHPAGASAWGVEDLVGNGWEWTSTVFGPFPGFEVIPSYPEYSADFFDGEHYVMKGASPMTARELVRPSFRNWFRSRYPYVYAGFRCVRQA